MAQLEFSVDLPGRGAPRRVQQKKAMRVLILGDFAGQHRRQDQVDLYPALADRHPVALTQSSFDTVMRLVSPRLLSAAGEVLRFAGLRDFHPDQLLLNVPELSRLYMARRDLRDPRRFEEGVQALQGLVEPPVVPAPAEQARDILGRLTGRVQETSVGDAKPGDILRQLVASVSTSHQLPKKQDCIAWLHAVEQQLSVTLREVLQQPSFVALESIWRGTHELLAALDEDTVQLELFDAAPDELLDELQHVGARPLQTSWARSLGPGGQPEGWDLIVAHYEFSPSAPDCALLAALGTLARSLGVPLIAGAGGHFRDWAALSPEQLALWTSLRRSDVGPWLGLVAPRVMSRLPYGRRGEQIERFNFEEVALLRPGQGIVWGNSVVHCARIMIQRYLFNDGAGEQGDSLLLDDLPSYVGEQQGNRYLQPVLEEMLDERAAGLMIRLGLMPWLGQLGGPEVRLARLHSLADPSTALELFRR